MRWHKWVVLIARSTGSALRAVCPFQPSCTANVRFRGKADMMIALRNAFDPKEDIKPKNHRGILMQPHVRWSFPRIVCPQIPIRE
jgi:hypothetical protein